MTVEYYELTLTHRVQDGGRHDPHIEPPLTVKCVINPLVPEAFDKYVMINEMCRKLQEYCKREEKTDES